MRPEGKVRTSSGVAKLFRCKRGRGVLSAGTWARSPRPRGERYADQGRKRDRREIAENHRWGADADGLFPQVKHRMGDGDAVAAAPRARRSAGRNMPMTNAPPRNRPAGHPVAGERSGSLLGRSQHRALRVSPRWTESQTLAHATPDAQQYSHPPTTSTAIGLRLAAARGAGSVPDRCSTT
jgi:hypothetical protein